MNNRSNTAGTVLTDQAGDASVIKNDTYFGSSIVEPMFAAPSQPEVLGAKIGRVLNVTDPNVLVQPPQSLQIGFHVLDNLSRILQSLADCEETDRDLIGEMGQRLEAFLDASDMLSSIPLYKKLIKDDYFEHVTSSFLIVQDACAKYAQETELINCAETLTQRCEVMRKNYQGCRAKVDQEFMNHYMVADQLQPECAHLKYVLKCMKESLNDSIAFFNPSSNHKPVQEMFTRTALVESLEDSLSESARSLNAKVGVA